MSSPRCTAGPINWSFRVPPTLSRRRVGLAVAKSRVNPRLTMPTLKIRTQIILPFLLLMLILGVIGSYLTTSLVATSLENRIADQLVHSEDAALDAAVKLQGRQVAAIRLGAHVGGGVRLETPLAGVLKEMQAKAQAEVALLDASGRLLGSTVPGIKGDLIDQNLRSYLALASPGRAATRSISVSGQDYEF